MGFAWKQHTAAAIAGSYLLVSQRRHLPSYFAFSSYGGTFALLFFLQGLAWTTWVVILYPKYFSPIRHLPSPGGNSMFMGQFFKITATPSGEPARDWYVPAVIPRVPKLTT